VIGLPDLPKAVDHSIASGYQGLFAPSAPARNGSTASQPMTRMERNIANLKGLRDLEEISD
jgi:hypothetical protein